MRVVVNGAEREVAPGATVESVVRELTATSERGVAVAVDRAVVPRAEWGATELREGQEVEVLRAVAGG